MRPGGLLGSLGRSSGHQAVPRRSIDGPASRRSPTIGTPDWARGWLPGLSPCNAPTALSTLSLGAHGGTSTTPRSPIAASALGAMQLAAESAATVACMQVTRHNFASLLPVVRQAFQECQFFSFDCEMTGLFADGVTEEYLDDFEDRYRKLAMNAQNFLVSQFGLSFFIWQEGHGYVSKTFNFYIFPKPFQDFDRRFMCQASSLDFLASQGFDFNKFIYSGIPFLPLHMRDKKLAALQGEQNASTPAAAGSSAASSTLSDQERDVMEETRSLVTSWLSSGEQELQLRAGAAQDRSAQMVALQQQLKSSPQPAFSIQEVPAPDAASTDPHSNILLLTRLSEAAAAAAPPASTSAPQTNPYAAKSLDTLVQEVQDATGFSVVFEMMRDSGKPAVGHNLLMDLGFSIHQFVEPLPRTWDGYKELVSRWLPGGVYDTKYVAKQLSSELTRTNAVAPQDSKGPQRPVSDVFYDTSLEGLYSSLQERGQAIPALEHVVGQHLMRMGCSAPGPAGLGLPHVDHAPGYEDYRETSGLASATRAMYSGPPLAVPHVGAGLGEEVAGGAVGGGAAGDVGVGAPLMPVCDEEADAGLPHSMAPRARRPRAHEAGYDAYMTGAVFARLNKLTELHAYNGSGPDPLAPSSMSSLPSLHAVGQYNGRQFIPRSDLPYFNLLGPDPMPVRPNVFYITGLRPQARAGEVISKFVAAGLGRVRVAMATSPGPPGKSQQKAAFVEVLKHENVSKVASALKKEPWKIVKYSDYYYSKLAQGDVAAPSVVLDSEPAKERPQQGQAAAGRRSTRPAPQVVQGTAPQAAPAQQDVAVRITRQQQAAGAGSAGTSTDSSSKAAARSTASAFAPQQAAFVAPALDTSSLVRDAAHRAANTKALDDLLTNCTISASLSASSSNGDSSPRSDLTQPNSGSTSGPASPTASKSMADINEDVQAAAEKLRNLTSVTLTPLAEPHSGQTTPVLQRPVRRWETVSIK